LKLKKLKGFTLLEMLLAMTISVILLGIGFNSIFYFQSQYAQLANNNDYFSAKNYFISHLKNEFIESTLIKYSDYQVDLTLTTHEVSYNFKSTHIEKKIETDQQVIIDTINIIGEIMEAKFESETIEYGITDFIELRLNSNQSDEVYSFKKQYVALDLYYLFENEY